MIVGIPNVGKSTFINSFVGKASTKTGNKPGVTKGKQWIRLSKTIELLDTPGILWPKFEDQAVGLKLALIGSINDSIINTTDLSLELIILLQKNYPNVLVDRYGLSRSEEELDMKGATKLLEQIAIKRSCLLKGGEPDLDRAAGLLVDDFRSIKLGNITLEFPPVKAKEPEAAEALIQPDVKNEE
jgi:ribosome biogenesis GTPase A